MVGHPANACPDVPGGWRDDAQIHQFGAITRVQ
jgi:hypothetical protein